MLFYPFEKDLNVPPGFVELSYCRRWQFEVVCKKDKAFLRACVVEPNPA